MAVNAAVVVPGFADAIGWVAGGSILLPGFVVFPLVLVFPLTAVAWTDVGR